MYNLAYELHKPRRRKFKRRRVFSGGIDKIHVADLIEMQHFAKDNDGYRYILANIDIFSKYGWLVPLKNKSGEAVYDAFKKFFSERKPGKLWVDKGKEFYNQKVKSLIELYSTENEEKSAVVERWNRTMKEKMFRYFTAEGTRRYLEVLPDMVDEYNNTVHSSIKMTPIEASDPENEYEVFKTLYPEKFSIAKNKKKIFFRRLRKNSGKKKNFRKRLYRKMDGRSFYDSGNKRYYAFYLCDKRYKRRNSKGNILRGRITKN